jgi:sugar O-acyltransferase (sialic acid O-acetyltransferase NeuD family)
MKSLLILGAGGHGQVVKEIAEACGYDTIAFLDDIAPNAIGKMNETAYLAPNYDGVIVAIGNNALRQKIVDKLERLENVSIATLIHPTAYVSPSTVIEAGTVVEPKAVVNARSKIGSGCIISVGAIVDHDCIIGHYSHINAGAICMAGSKVEALSKVNAGEVIKGF